ncbi:MAG TPA: malto-oligosyltrehalose trehalohydrolase [Acidimicrobiales bacterium]|nr:malto-oligosyltrehalose trehalohydrolase [Acidimicrobiales bacterium]
MTRPGATVVDGGRISFSVWAPSAQRVDVVLVPSGTRVALECSAHGVFSGLVAGGPGTRYRYVLDDALERPDPASALQPEGVHGPSEVVELGSYEWHDDGFVPVPLRDAILYELHIGTFSPGGTFTSAIPLLDDLVRLGVTAIEIMPVAEFPGTRNWGYDGVFLYAVQHSYGGPVGLQRFVDECHRRGLAVILDVVYNHLGPEGNILPDFAPYLTDKYHTPWGPAVNLDGPDSDGVRHFLSANALRWLADFHIDGLRLDAVHELVDRSARPFLAELACAVADFSELSGRAAWLIAESADNDPRVVRAQEVGGLGLRAQWNDDFHHAVHSALTGEETGYYGDYGGATDVARAMDQGFVFQGQYSSFRRRRHGAPSEAEDPSKFVVFGQNHDQIGNRPDAARLATLVPAERVRMAAALVLLAPGIPLLFMGEEYGETAPFAYFVDHSDPALLEAVRRGRGAETVGQGADHLDPADRETFCRSVLDPDRRHDGVHEEIWELYRSLLALRAAEPALRRSGRSTTTAHAEGRVVNLLRSHHGTSIACYFNLSASPALALLPVAAGWEELLHPVPLRSDGEIALDPWQFRVFRSTPTRIGAA